jgi:hypothetical protein
MDEGTEFFLLLPMEGHREPADAFFQKRVPGLSPQDRGVILSRIDTVYGGLKEKKFQAVVTGSFPELLLRGGLSAKNGWARITSSSLGRRVTYYRHAGGNVEVYTGYPGMIFLAEDVLPMIDRAGGGGDDFLSQGGLPQWVLQGGAPDGEIRFYSAHFSALIQGLTGIPLPREGAVAAASGEGILTGRDGGEPYSLTLMVDVKDKRAVIPAKLLFSLAGFFSGAQVSSGDDTVITISGIAIKADALAGFL